MIGVIVRLTILFAVVFGLVYGLARSVKRKHQKNLDREKELVLARLRALAEAQKKGELTQAEADELTWQVYLESKVRGIDLAREEVDGLADPQAEGGKEGEKVAAPQRELEPQD